MFEKINEPLASFPTFVLRMAKYLFFSFLFIIFIISIGTVGYYYFENMTWIDAFTNSSMTLADMGLISHLSTSTGKIFAAIYAVISGLLFFTISGIIFSPIIHRVLHTFHINSILINKPIADTQKKTGSE